MILTRLLKNIVRPPAEPLPGNDPQLTDRPSVLNVGGGMKQIAIPSHYDGWTHLLLDIAPGPDVDVVLDARQLLTLGPAQFDAIYCSHNLEHYYRHDCVKVLAGFLHVLKPDGYAEIRVPDMTSVLQAMVNRKLDIDDVLYTAAAGPITVHDVIYGWGEQIERSGVDFYAHKRGFTAHSLSRALQDAGFAQIGIAASEANFEIRALAFKAEPTAAQRATFGF
ncbi:MAG: methyltransferase domain-containing protein [Pseudomonadota bacterium]